MTYAGSREEAGVTVAVLQLEVSAGTNAAAIVPRGEAEAEQTVTMEFELEGELYWDLEAGRLHGLLLSGKQSSEVVNTSEFSRGADPMELVQTMLFDGEISFEVTVEQE